MDEAYIDFSSRPSWIRRLNEFHNLVVLQTFSKAWGSAGVRLGMAFASPDIIGYYNQVKYPYNISGLVQRYAMEMLDRENEVRRWVDEILSGSVAVCRAFVRHTDGKNGLSERRQFCIGEDDGCREDIFTTGYRWNRRS